MATINKKMHIKLKDENGLYLSCVHNGSDVSPVVQLSKTPYSWLVRFVGDGAGQLDTHLDGKNEPYHVQPKNPSEKEYDAILTTKNIYSLKYNFVDPLVMDEASIELHTKGRYLGVKDNASEVEFNESKTLWVMSECKD